MYRLSFPQLALFLDAIKRGSTTKFNMSVVSAIRGPLDAGLFRRSIEFAQDVHDIRRMRIRFDGMNPMQEFLPADACPCPFTQVDLSGCADPRQAAVEWILRDYAVPMPFENAALHGDALLRLGDDLHFWYQKFQHIANDAFGLSLVDETVGKAYNSLLLTGRLPDIDRYSYVDFLEEDLAYASSERYRADEAFWAGKFQSMPEPLPFTKRKNGLAGAHQLNTERYVLEVGSDVYDAMVRRCRDEGISPAQFLLAVLFAYLNRVTGRSDIVVGTPILNRSNHAFRRTAGLFMGMMPLRMSIDGQSTLFRLASAINSETRSCYRHQRFPVGDIIRRCRTLDGFCNGVYDVTFVYRDVDFSTVFGEARSSTFSLDAAAREESLSIEVDAFDKQGAVNIFFSYNPLLISALEVRQMARVFGKLVEDAAAGRNPVVNEFSLGPIASGRAKDCPVSTGPKPPVPDLVWQRAAETPDATAVVCCGKRITYEGLTTVAGRIAAALCSVFGAGQEEPVAVLCDRGIEWISAMLGIMRAGCAYLPIDPETPRERISFILRDSGCRLVLVGDRFTGERFDGVRTLPIAEASQYDGPATLYGLTSGQLAYIIYTSGTTGEPKGVLIEHGGFANVISELARGWEMTPEDRVLGFSSPMFDASLVDYFLPLVSGGSVVIVPKEVILDPIRFLELIRSEQVTVAMLTPTYLSALGRVDLSPLRLLGTAGEAANPADVAYHVRSRAFFNAYGPTEITIISNYLKLEAGSLFTGDSVPVGKAIGGTTIRILDEALRPMPDGAVGEICIGGQGVSRGYLGRPELTADRFIADPENPGERLYRSGDLGCMLPDGTVEYHGRRDSQVKVRGYRIELGEIESVLKTHPSVENAVVTKRKESDSLVAYVVPRGAFDRGELRRFLSGRLPAYMVPNTWIRLDAFPRNTSGKVLYDALPGLAEAQSAMGGAEPVTHFSSTPALRHELMELWSEILDGVPVGPEDDFFALGGHSLKAIALVSRMQERMGISLGISDFFDNPTVAGLAAAIERLNPAAGSVRDAGRSSAADDSLRHELMELWSEILDGVQVGPEDDFFALGGHSLKAMALMSRMQERMGVTLEISDFFENPTVSGLVAAIGRRPGPEDREGPDPAGGAQVAHAVVDVDGFVMAQKEEIARLAGMAVRRCGVPAVTRYGDLSSLQERLLLVQKLAPETMAYLIPMHLMIRGRLDVGVLSDAIGFLWKRHDALRTVFPVVDGRPQRMILPPVPPVVPVYDFSRRDDDWKAHYLAAREPFNMEEGPLLSARIYILGEDDHACMVDIHHINVDGASLDQLRSELFVIYEALADDRTPELPPVGEDYGAFVGYEAALRATDGYRKRLDHRIAQLAGAPTLIDFCFDRQPPARFSHSGRMLTDQHADRSRDSRVAEAASRAGISPFTMYLAAFGTMLHLHTGQETLLVGIPASLRGGGRFDRTVGFFVNTCVARLDFTGQPTLEEVMKRSAAAVRDMLGAHDVFFEHLVQALCPQRMQARPPLVQASLSYMLSDDRTAPTARGLAIEPFIVRNDSAMFELTMDILQGPVGSINCIEYSTDLWDEESVRRMQEDFRIILEAFIEAGDRRIADINLMQGARRTAVGQLLECAASGGFSGFLPDAVAGHAQRAPERTAIVSGGLRTSYGKLGRLVSRRRGMLRSLGMGRRSVLALACRPGIEWTISALAAMAEGVVVVPVDTAVPSERLNHILDNSGASLLWHDGAFAHASGWSHASCRCLDCREAFLGDPVQEPSGLRDSDPAYIIYTSGTTGLPKGVVVGHGAFEAHCRSAAAAYGLTCDDCSLVFAPPYVDAAWEQLFAILWTGGTALVRDARLWAPDLWCRNVSDFRATCVDIPAQYLQELLFYWKTMPGSVPASIRLVICGGEAMPVSLAEAWLSGPLGAVPLINAYGPTEGVVTATFHRIGRESRIDAANAVVPIGGAMPGRVLRVLNAEGGEVGPGIPGELCIGGPCLADGYVGDEARTGSAFRYWCRTPEGARWAGKDESGSIRLYRTGDRVRIAPDGLVEFLGRIDRQFQIRGFRVEPGEIESLLVRHPGISRAFVHMPEERGAHLRLAAWCVPTAATPPAAADLSEWLGRWLPGHMVPDSFIFVDAFPLTANDKVDVSALPLPDPAVIREVPATRPADQLEAGIAAIWADVLGRDGVGLNDNFFDIGGQSILLLRVHTRMQSELGISLPLVDLFAHPTVSRLAGRLRGDRQDAVVRRKNDNRGGVAVIGMAGRFPGAEDVGQLWENLVAGRESIRFYTQDELAAAGVPANLRERPDYVPAHGFMAGTSLFDPGFFGYTPREAETIDPQQRLFLEESWHALEHAGYDPGRFRGDIGVFAGMGMNLYLLNNLAPLFRDGHGSESYAISLSNDKDFIASRVSYKLDLRGPSVNVNTACSTSLVAIHMAAASLLAGECDMALAGGVTLQLEEGGYVFQPEGIMSPDGHCRAFADDAAGTVGGSGGAVVVLKRLDDALADGDTVHAVIRGSAVNNDGSDKVGFTAPGVHRQRDVIRAALEKAGLEPADIGYIEAHGTGTPMGDPIEVQALTDAFQPARVQPGSCYIGSIKGNIGHLDTAGGVAGFIKAVHAVRHGLIPPSINCSRPSTRIDFDRTPFSVAQRLIPWSGSGPRRAGVSSFGMGGTNAHLILEEPPQLPAPDAPRQAAVWCIPVSARSAASLKASAEKIARHLESEPGIDPSDLWYTLAEGRRLHPVRLVVIAGSLQASIALLRSLDDGLFLRTDREGRPISGSGRIGMPGSDGEPAFSGAVAFAESWLAGNREEAARHLPEGPNRRIPLPGYVFDHRSYWVAAAPGEVATGRHGSEARGKRPLDAWFHFPGWEPLPLRRTASGAVPPILLIHEGGRAAACWEHALRAAGVRFAVCRGGDGLDERLRSLAVETGLPSTCWHLSSLAYEPSGPEAYALRLARLLDEIGALASAGADGMELLLFAPLRDGGPDAPTDPSFAYLEAACAVVPHEYAGVRARVLRTAPYGADASAVLAVAGTGAQDSRERLLTLHQGRLWRRTYSAFAPDSRNSGMARCPENGVYLVTGGTGGIGLTIAAHLASAFRARLLLISRSAPDAASLDAIRSMEAAGAEVATAEADVADAGALRAAVDAAVARWGRIDGVIHAAGVGGGSLIAATGLREIERVMRAKVSGTLALADALRGREPGFVVLCSSLTASLGGPGQAAYAAANAWLDAWAAVQGERWPGLWTSIQWDAWASVGMAARMAVRPDTPAAATEPALLRSWTISPDTYWPWGEHLVNGIAMLPGTAYLEFFVQALPAGLPVALGDVTLSQPMVHGGEKERTVVVVRAGDELILQSDDGGGRVEHARARLEEPESRQLPEPLEASRTRCGEVVDIAVHRPQPEGPGGYIIDARSRWKIAGDCRKGVDEAVSTFELPASLAGDLSDHPLHPALLDVAISYYIAFVEEGLQLLPWRYSKVSVFAPLTPRIVSRTRLRNRSGRSLALDVDILDDAGSTLVRIEGYTLVRPGAGNDIDPARHSAVSAANPYAITPEEGAEVFFRALASAEPVLCISTMDWAFAENPAALPAGEPRAMRSPAAGSARKPRPEQESPFMPPRSKGEELLADVWGEVLGYDGLGIDDDLFELGADSLSALQAMARVEEIAGSSFAMERFFSSPTIAGLAAAIDMPETEEGRIEAFQSIEHWEEGEL